MNEPNVALNENPTWRNRIVGHGEEEPDALLANPFNWRIHPTLQQKAVAGVLGEVGWVDTVLVNLRTSDEWPEGERGIKVILDGHLRVLLGRNRRERSVPTSYVDLTPEEERLVLATFDATTLLAEVDAAVLPELLARVQTDDEAILAMLAGLAERAAAIEVEPADEFREYDEELETEHECPKCGYRWS